jgi:hypothetical protein
MVLACGPEDVAALDMGTGALVRLRVDDLNFSGQEARRDRTSSFTPFDLLDATWRVDPQRDDLAQPEAVSVDGPPQVVGSVHGRRARGLLRHLVVPPGQHLLGFAGTSAPYWEFSGMHPSLAVVEPTRGPVLFRRSSDESVWARFGWPRSDNWLPVEDGRAVSALKASGRERVSGRELAKVLGFRPQFVVVTLSRPRDGHCYKTVAAILPRP